MSHLTVQGWDIRWDMSHLHGLVGTFSHVNPNEERRQVANMSHLPGTCPTCLARVGTPQPQAARGSQSRCPNVPTILSKNITVSNT